MNRSLLAACAGAARRCRPCAVRAVVRRARGARQGDGGDSEHVQSPCIRLTASASRSSAIAPARRRCGLVDAAGGEPKQITQGTDPVGSVAWSPVEDPIAYDVARGGGFNAQVFLSKPDGSDAKRITSGGKEDNFSGDFAPDGRYWFRSAQRDPQAPDSWIYDPKTGKAAIAIQYDGFGGIIDIERPGQSRTDLAPRHARQHQPVPARSARRTRKFC